MGKMVALFLRNAPERLEALRSGLDDRDWTLVERTAHSLKSSAAYLGLGVLRGLAEQAEDLACQGRGPEVRPLLAGFDRAFLAARPELARVLRDLHAS